MADTSIEHGVYCFVIMNKRITAKSSTKFNESSTLRIQSDDCFSHTKNDYKILGDILLKQLNTRK